jgi:hypothetical protein
MASRCKEKLEKMPCGADTCRKSIFQNVACTATDRDQKKICDIKLPEVISGVSREKGSQ